MKSNNSHAKAGVVKKKIDKRKLAVQIVAWVLVAMMVITGLYTAIYFLVLNVGAADDEVDASVAVGLLYGSSIDVALTSETTNGYIVGTEKVGMYEKTFTELWRLDGYKKASVLCDANYYFDASRTAYRTPTASTPANVGAYRLELDLSFSTPDELRNAMTAVDYQIAPLGYSCVPAYVDGVYKLRIGSFLSEEEAVAAQPSIEVAVQQFISDFTFSVKTPSDTGMTVVEHNTNKPLFEYDCGESYRVMSKDGEYECLALDAIDNADGTKAYLKFLKYIYDGVFAFRRYPKDSSDGISLVNIAPLEDYVMGVLPYEVPNSWPSETLRAFAIVARTYVLTHMDKYWNVYGFNVCGTSNSQVYRGVGSLNDNVREAVMSTAGIVVTYDDKLAEMYYSSSTGNCTADAANVWGSSVAWLKSVETPWEDYLNHKHAFWNVEVSPHDLYVYLSGRYAATGDKALASLNNLQGDIADITIDSYAGENSTYVSQVTITDIYGNTATVSRCDKIRKAFSNYLYSANFVVGLGNVDYTEYLECLAPGEVKAASESEPVAAYAATPVNEDNILASSADGSYVIVSADGESDGNLNEGFYVVYNNGESVYAHDLEELVIITSEGTSSIPIIDSSDDVDAPDDTDDSDVDNTGDVNTDTDSDVDNTGDVNTDTDNGVDNTGDVNTDTNSGIEDNTGSVDNGNTTVSGNTVTKTMSASSSGNFIFVGKGWGHGVGLSQWGLRDLADMNINYEDMIKAYCSGVEFDNYKNIIDN